MTLFGTIDPNAAGLLTNTVTVAAPLGVTDTNAGNNTATDIDTLTPPTADPSEQYLRAREAEAMRDVDVPGSRHLGSIRYTPHMPHRRRTGSVLSVLARKSKHVTHGRGRVPENM
jgi:hypothetical protein